MTSLDTVLYDVDGPVATITMNRPEKSNAQNSALLEDLDRAFDLAEQDGDVNVVILAAAGRHFSSGHDLSYQVDEDAIDPWQARRDTPEGKLEHETVMFWDKTLRIRNFPKITIAEVRGACIAAGVMTASACDLIVAGESAFFRNPVAKMSAVGVEVLVEPYAMGFRQAKEFMLTGRKMMADEALRLGWVNHVVPDGDLEAFTRDLAHDIAKVPQLTAQLLKRSINDAEDNLGMQVAWRNHFMIHQFMSATPTALAKLAERQQKSSMRDIVADRDGD